MRPHLFERRSHQLHELGVCEVVDDVLENVPVRDKAERSEDDYDWNLGPDVGDGAMNAGAGDVFDLKGGGGGQG